jgi:hypothetical protein
MVRCADFYEKWKRDPNWCEKSPKAVEQIDHYLALVEEITEQGVEPIAIYKNLPEKVGREIYKLKGDPRKTIVINSAGKIKRGEKVSTGDVNVWLGIEPKTPSQSDEEKRTKVPNPTPVPSVKPEPAQVPEPEKVEQKAWTLSDKIKAQKVIEEPAEVDADGFFIPKKIPPPATVPAAATPDKERIVKECLIAVLSPKVMEKVDVMIAGGKWEKTYLDFLVIVVKDGTGRKL